MRCTRQLRQNLFLHFAEQPRFMAYKLLQLTVEVRSSEGGLCMAAPLQRSGEYDVFSSDESVCPRSAVDLDSGDELMPTKCPHSSHPSNLQDRTSARLLTSPFHGGAESRVQIPELRVPMSPQMPHGPLSKHTAPPLRAAVCRVQSTITWLLTHSHDTSPSSVAAVFGTALLFTRYQPPDSGLPCVENTLSFT